MQETLSGELQAPNVASVPQYSPFRYPGGKSRHHPFASKWINSLKDSKTSSILVEPFAGGAHIGLAAGIEDLVDEVVLAEIDENVAAVWKVILEGDADWLIDQIDSLELTEDNVEEIFDARDESVKNRALAMIIHNRISRGGITAPGAGRLNHGENGKGIRSRWYPDTLVERITRIVEVRDRFQFVHGDGFDVMEEYSTNPDALFFIDPPYPEAGKRLYAHSDVDHEEVFRMASEASGDALITYDNSEEIKEYAEEYGFEVEPILMSTTHHREKYELIICQDFSWLRD